MIPADDLKKKRESFLLGKFQHPLIDPEHFKFTVNGKPSLISEESIQKLKSNLPDTLPDWFKGIKLRRTVKRDLKTKRELAPGKEPFSNFEEELALPYSVVVDDKGKLFALYEGKDVEGKSKVLGKGAFGQVKFAQNLETGELCIVKVQQMKSSLPKPENDEIALEHWVNQRVAEGQLAERAKIQLTSFTRFEAHRQYDIQVYGGDDLTFQLSPYPEKVNPIYKDRTVPWSMDKDYIKDMGERLDIAIKFFQQMEKMHKRGIIHCDIKPANILYDKKTGEVTIIDYGLASPMGKNGFVIGKGGSPFAQAPEIFSSGGICSRATDTFAGHTVLNALFGFYCDPSHFDDKTRRFNHFDPVVNFDERFFLLEGLVPGPRGIEQHFLMKSRQIVEAMTAMDPNNRILDGQRLDSPKALEAVMKKLKDERILNYTNLMEDTLETLKKYSVDLSSVQMDIFVSNDHEKISEIIDIYRNKFSSDRLALNAIENAITTLSQIPDTVRTSVLNRYQEERKLILERQEKERLEMIAREKSEREAREAKKAEELTELRDSLRSNINNRLILIEGLATGPRDIERNIMDQYERIIRVMTEMDPNDRIFDGQKLDSLDTLKAVMKKLNDDRILSYTKLMEDKLEILKKYGRDLPVDQLKVLKKFTSKDHANINKFMSNITKNSLDMDSQNALVNAIITISQMPDTVRTSVLDRYQEERLEMIAREKSEREAREAKELTELRDSFRDFQEKIQAELNNTLHPTVHFKFIPEQIKLAKALPDGAIELYRHLNREDDKIKYTNKPHLADEIESERKQLLERFPALKEAVTIKEENVEVAPNAAKMDEDKKKIMNIIGALLIKNKEYINKYNSGKKAKTQGGMLFSANTEAKYRNAVGMDKEINELLKTPESLDQKEIIDMLSKYDKLNDKTQLFAAGEVRTMLHDSIDALKNLGAKAKPPQNKV